MVQRERVAGRALFAVRRNYTHFAQAARRFGEHLDSNRQIPVIVGNEDAHEVLVALVGVSSSARYFISARSSATICLSSAFFVSVCSSPPLRSCSSFCF